MSTLIWYIACSLLLAFGMAMIIDFDKTFKSKKSKYIYYLVIGFLMTLLIDTLS